MKSPLISPHAKRPPGAQHLDIPPLESTALLPTLTLSGLPQ